MKIKIILSALFCSLLIMAQSDNSGRQIIWKINGTKAIGNDSTIKIGNPTAVITEADTVLRFNGSGDGLMVYSNPLSGAGEFTVEVIFMPDSASSEKNHEQRYLHIQQSQNRRILMELRLAKDNKWFLDTFIKSDTSSKTLYSENMIHPTGRWYNAALVYKNGIMKDFVNGKKELEGKVNFIPMDSGIISIGVRQDLRSWFNGKIKEIRFTKKALSPSDFIKAGN